MSPPSNPGNGNGRGPPPWAGPPDHVQEDGETVHVDDRPEHATRERAINATDQMDRIEAKLDLLITELIER